MAYHQLVLPKNKYVQQKELLESLNQSDSNILEQTLASLSSYKVSEEAIVKFQSPTENERIISLKILSNDERTRLLELLTMEEQSLYKTLEQRKPHS